MVMAHDWLHGVWKIDRLQNVCADVGVDLHTLELRRREWPWLVQDVLWDSQFPCVMKQGGCSYRVELLFIRHSKSVGDLHGVPLHAPDVPVRDLVLCVDRQRQSFDRRQKDTVQLFVLVLLGLNSLGGPLVSEVDDKKQRRLNAQIRNVDAPCAHDERGHRSTGREVK